MKRRQFMKSVAATAAAPMMPSSLANAYPVTHAQYAQAVEAASVWAYTTVGNLKQLLGVDGAACQAVLARLQTDGVLGVAGPHGLSLTKSFLTEQAQVAAQMTTRVTTATASRNQTSKIKNLLCDDTPDLEDEPPEACKDNTGAAST